MEPCLRYSLQGTLLPYLYHTLTRTRGLGPAKAVSA